MVKPKVSHCAGQEDPKHLRASPSSQKSSRNVKWTEEEISSLFSLVNELGEDWTSVSSKLPGKTTKQCMLKYRGAQKDAKKGSWTEGEDTELLRWVEEQGPTRWTECSRRIRGRCGKQCRERWVNILNPGVKRGNWSTEEQALVFQSLRQFHTSWSAMSRELKGRTENSIKNYFYSSVRRLRSNPVTQLLRDIHVLQRTSFEQVREADHYLSSEIGKLNRLSEDICRFLLQPAGSEEPFRQFLVSVLFSEDDSENGENKPGQAFTPGNKHCISPSTEVAASQASGEDTQVMFEMIWRIIKKSGNPQDPKRLLRSFQETLDEKNQIDKPSKSVTLSIPFCWNCTKHSGNTNSPAL